MTDIPADIAKAAQQAYDAYADGAGKDIRECIARAIMAELEACAKIADEIAEETACGEGEIYIATKIASTIRSERAGE